MEEPTADSSITEAEAEAPKESGEEIEQPAPTTEEGGDNVEQETAPVEKEEEKETEEPKPEPEVEAAKEEEETEPAAEPSATEEAGDDAEKETAPVEKKEVEEPPKVEAEVEAAKEGGEIEPAAEASATTEKEGDKIETEQAPVEKEEEKEEVKPKRAARSKVRSTNPVEGVDIAYGDSKIESVKPITFGQQFQDTVERYGDVVALKWKVEVGEGEEKTMEWKGATFKEYYAMCIQAAKSLLKLGLEDNHGVGIIGFNSPEWVVANNAAIFAGGLAAGIYATNGPEACHYVLEDSKSNVVVVENQKQLDKILEVRDRLPHLKAIVQYKGKLSKEYENVYDWEQFMELGKDMEDSVIEDKMKAQRPEQCALLIYTSGTTGNPKGVMLSHDNLTWTAKALHETIREEYNLIIGNERVVSYLPLSHIAAQMEDVYLCVYGAATLYFAQPDALKGSLRQTLLEVRPTLFFGVPRVWEKFEAAMQAALAEVTGIKKKLGNWAMGVGFQGNTNVQNRRGLPWTFGIANSLVLKKVHQLIGLDCVKIALTGAAPIHVKTIEFFMSVNIPLLELYGMSEDAGPHSFNTKSQWRVGSVGHPMLGAKCKIDHPDENGEGEICMYGRHVFMGYMNNEEKTKEAIDDEGWLHSGDIGRIDKDGYIFITGRIKELVITAGGENMAPVPVEDRIKKELPFLSNVMMIGDKRKFVTCLVTLKSVVDLDTGEPQDELLPEAKTLIAKLGSNCTKVSEIVSSKDEKVYSEITAGLERANKHAVSHAQKVQKFVILEKDFSMPGGELGPTLKLKRHVVVKKYAEQIDSMYDVSGEAAAKP